jgi:uroporphyrinogen III methyltransferase / synthase
VSVPEPGAGPLAGVRVLVPRAPEQAAALSERIRALGGDPVEAPVLRIEDGDLPALRAAVRDLAAGAFSLVCLTSPNGVAALADVLERQGLDARALAAAGILACVGPGTAAALWDRLRVRPDLLPDRATTEALGESVPAGTGRALLPRADIASPILPELLRAKGYDPVEVTAYRTVAPDGLAPEVIGDLESGTIDLLAFASPSTVRNFLTLVGDRSWRGQVISIGPVTSRTCRELDVEVAVEADPHDLDGLVDALVAAATR